MSFSAAGLGALMNSKDPRFLEWIDQINAQTNELTNDQVMFPSQQPNYVGTDSISSAEAFGVNELFRARNDQGFDTLRALGNVGGDLDQQVANARNEAGQSSDVTEGIFNRRTEGLDLSDRQRAGARQTFSLNRAVTEAANVTGTRRRNLAQQRQADRAVTGFEDIMFGQEMAGLTGLANAEGQRQIRKANEKASKKASRNSLLGTVGGLAIAAVAAFSSEEYKDQTQEKPKLLDKLKDIRIDKWRYKGSKPEHIGPYAEEFNETFGVGRHADAIDLVSLLGVTLGSIKELNEKVEAIG